MTKKKRKLKKQVKLFLIIICILLILLITCIIYKSTTNKITISNTELEIGSSVTIKDLVGNTKLDITNQDEKIDTSTLGSKDITIKYKDNNIEKNYQTKIKIIDTTKPQIEVDDNLLVKVNTDSKLEDMITITDNSSKKITPVINGDYDLKKVGEYNITITATDSSKNTATKNVTLKVTKNISYNSDGSLQDGEYPTSKSYTVKVKNGVATVDGIIIVNKTYSLPKTYVPSKPYKEIGNRGYCTDCIEDIAMQAFLKMQSDAKKLGLSLRIGSGFRSYQTQVTLYNNYAVKDGYDAADTYSARAGYSEHQSGLCFDLNSDNDAFTNTKEGIWVNDNAYKYGLVIRFPKNKDKYTGYTYESWHLRYVGTELAEKLYNNGDWLSLEEYFGLDSKYPAL